MKNAREIIEIAHQIGKTSEMVDTFARSIAHAGESDTADLLETMLCDEVEHIQMLTLKLTELITADEDGDTVANPQTDEGGSVFGPGDLTVEKAAPPLEGTEWPEASLKGGAK